MKSVKVILTSFRYYVIFVVVAMIAALIFPEFFFSLFFSEPFELFETFNRLFITTMMGALTLIGSGALYMFFNWLWEYDLAFAQSSSYPQWSGKGYGESYGGGVGQTVEVAAVTSAASEVWTSDASSASSEIGKSDMGSDSSGGGGDSGGSDSGAGGGDYGGGGGDYGGGGSGGSWS